MMETESILRIWYAQQNRETRKVLAAVVAAKLKKQTLLKVLNAHVQPIAA